MSFRHRFYKLCCLNKAEKEILNFAATESDPDVLAKVKAIETLINSIKEKILERRS